MNFIFFILGVFSSLNVISAYKPIILMHGVIDNAKVFNTMIEFITKAHPGTNVTALDMFDGSLSMLPMWHQINKIKPVFNKIMQSHPQGVHLLGFSQGGLLCRGLLESLPSHNVHNFISLSAPQAGQYGDASKFKHFFPHFIKKEMYKFFYTKIGQETSVGNYWNDPHHQDLYLKYSAYLAVINNQTQPAKSQAYKKSMTKLKNLILIGGPDDDVITPWQSSHFAAYNEKETVVEMRDQEWYKSDWFGLRTLDQRGALHTYVEPHNIHHAWPLNYTVFTKYIQPWLD